jgi:hypothetical protein
MAYFENFISNEVLQWMQSGEALVAGSHRLTLAGSLSSFYPGFCPGLCPGVIRGA